VQGYASSTKGSAIGVCGTSKSSAGIGVQGIAGSGSGKNIGVLGVSNSTSGIAIKAVAGSPHTVPLVASGDSSQVSNLQQWRVACSVKSVVSSNGSFGIGTACPKSALCVVGCATISGALKVGSFAPGSFSISIKTVTMCYPMEPSDFAILANMSGSCKAITLPSASQAGRMVYVKNVSQSNNVLIKTLGGDQIEAAANFYCSLPLSPQDYPSLTLVANGSSPGVWYNFGGTFSS